MHSQQRTAVRNVAQKKYPAGQLKDVAPKAGIRQDSRKDAVPKARIRQNS